MTRETRYKVNMVLRYVILLAVGVVMVYPLIWKSGAAFMTNEQIFSSVNFIPKAPTFSGYQKGFAGYQGMTLLHLLQEGCRHMDLQGLIVLAIVFPLQSCCQPFSCLR